MRGHRARKEAALQGNVLSEPYCPHFIVSFARKITWSPFPWQEVTAAPAVCNGILQGILTFADGCVLRADVGIYTRIFNYIPWIENTIRNN